LSAQYVFGYDFNTTIAAINVLNRLMTVGINLIIYPSNPKLV